MEKTIFECCVATPMFLKGANREVELRPSSLKGVIRYFYRALVIEDSIESLRKREADYFGSSDDSIGASKIRLIIKNANANDKRSERLIYTENHERSQEECFYSGKKFTIIALSSENHIFYAKLIMITLLLGGLGKRTRRGRGAVQVLSCSRNDILILNDYKSFIQQIHQLLEGLFPQKYEIANNKIIFREIPKLSKDEQYPYVKEIEIGKGFNSWEHLLKVIDTNSHEFRKRGGAECLGYARAGRLSSPIYVTVVKLGESYYPLITTLNTVTNKRLDSDYESIQKEYKNLILRGVIKE